MKSINNTVKTPFDQEIDFLVESIKQSQFSIGDYLKCYIEYNEKLDQSLLRDGKTNTCKIILDKNDIDKSNVVTNTFNNSLINDIKIIFDADFRPKTPSLLHIYSQDSFGYTSYFHKNNYLYLNLNEKYLFTELKDKESFDYWNQGKGFTKNILNYFDGDYIVKISDLGKIKDIFREDLLDYLKADYTPSEFQLKYNNQNITPDQIYKLNNKSRYKNIFVEAENESFNKDMTNIFKSAVIKYIFLEQFSFLPKKKDSALNVLEKRGLISSLTKTRLKNIVKFYPDLLKPGINCPKSFDQLVDFKYKYQNLIKVLESNCYFINNVIIKSHLDHYKILDFQKLAQDCFEEIDTIFNRFWSQENKSIQKFTIISDIVEYIFNHYDSEVKNIFEKTFAEGNKKDPLFSQFKIDNLNKLQEKLFRKNGLSEESHSISLIKLIFKEVTNISLKQNVEYKAYEEATEISKIISLKENLSQLGTNIPICIQFNTTKHIINNYNKSIEFLYKIYNEFLYKNNYQKDSDLSPEDKKALFLEKTALSFSDKDYAKYLFEVSKFNKDYLSKNNNLIADYTYELEINSFFKIKNKNKQK